MRRAAFASAVLSAFLIPGAIQAQARIGFVNMQEVMAAAPGTKEAQAEFNKEMREYQDTITKLQNELQRMQDQLQQQLMLSPEAKKNREQQMQAKQQEYQHRYQDLQNQANRRRQELMQPILTKIDSIMEKVRKEGRYSLILDASAGSILAADSALDLTQEVVGRLKVASPSDSSASAGGYAKDGTGGSQ